MGKGDAPTDYRMVRLPPVASDFLRRLVLVDAWVPSVRFPHSEPIPFLLLNDGQDAGALRLSATLNRLARNKQLTPLLVFALHAGNRIQEYGIAHHPDYKKRGCQAHLYTSFVMQELLPYLVLHFPVHATLAVNGIAGASLGALSAFDIGWNHPATFRRIGAFSGSFWWRSRSYEDGYDEYQHRIAHKMVRLGPYKPKLKFWFQAGTADEVADRNGNGIIDVIDDTLDLITELVHLGYRPFYDIVYCETIKGRHHPQTWAKALPLFLKWGWGRQPVYNFQI